MSARTANELPWWKRDVGELFKRKPKGTATTARPIPSPQLGPAPLPRADLLPQPIRDTIAIRHIRAVGLLLAVIILAPAVGLWTWWSAELSTLETERDSLISNNAVLQAETRTLTPVETLIRQVEAQQALLEDSLAAQPDAVAVLATLQRTAQVNGPVELDSVSVTYYPIPAPGEPTNPCPDPDPFSSEIAIGCMTFSATTDSRSGLADFLAALEANPLFVGPFVNTSSIAAQADSPDADRVTFSGSAGLSTEALVTPLSTEEIDAILNPPEPDETTAQDNADESEAGA